VFGKYGGYLHQMGSQLKYVVSFTVLHSEHVLVTVLRKTGVASVEAC
jgi:hypothetical protein